MENNDLKNFRQWIYEGIKRMPSENVEQRDLFACFNTKGNKPPIYWCFNNWVEAIFLARQLGSDQPLIAMHSFYGFLKGASTKKVHTLSVGETYGQLLLELHRGGPVFIGGNCQAAPISEVIAHFLLAKSGIAPVLITLEHQPFYSYPGNVVMLFGGQSDKFNPILCGPDPIPKWRRLYGAASWGIINGNHGQYFEEPSVFDLVAFLNVVIEAYVNGEPLSIGHLKIRSRQENHD